MDKNFINIDDLVRQRLTGAEEREPSGAWLRMRDLLDKEEPQKPIGFLYWRRIFSAVALLLFITSLSIGGYKLSSAPNGSNAPAPGLTLASANAANPTGSLAGKSAVSGNTQSVSPPANAGEGKSNDKAENDLNKENPNKNAASVTKNSRNDNKTKGAHLLAANTTVPKDKAVNKPAETTLPTTGNKATAVNEQANKNEQSNINPPHKTNNLATNNLATNSSTTTVSPVTNSPAPRSSATNSTTSNSSATSGSATNGTSSVTSSKITTSNSNAPSRATSSTLAATTSAANSSSSNSSATNNVAVKKHATRKAAPAVSAQSNNQKQIAGNTKNTIRQRTSGQQNNTLAIASKAIHNKSTGNPAIAKNTVPHKAGARVAATHPIVTPKVFASNSHALAPAKNMTAGSANKIANNLVNNTKKTPATKHTTPSGARASATNPASTFIPSSIPALSGTQSGNHPSNMNAGPSVNTDNVGNTADNTTAPNPTESNNSPVAAATSMHNKTTLEPLRIITRRSIKSADNTQMKFDTLSDFIQEFAVANAPSTAAGFPIITRANPASTARKTATAGTNGNSSTSTNNQVVAAAAPPAAGKSSTAKLASGTKEATNGSVAEMGDGTTGAEKLANLSAAFNDIKYKVGAAKFAPGLTAGINGTFFGPNSFKGFQFGFVGNFIFGDTWSIMTELEYFERINNNYSLNDAYYTSATKQLNTEIYSFANLHSFELPISARFHVANLNFFAGVNLAYNFSIDPQITEAAPVQATMQPAGVENAPKLNINAFGSRFDLGYLCGLSYQAAPNLMIDFRNVQSIWDNAKTPGGKMVSDQLYKSPSLQLSIIYLLGGNKGRK